MIQVTVKLFAVYQEAYQQPEIIVTLPDRTPIAAILEQVIREHPSLEQWRYLTRFGLNLQFVPPETSLEDGDEVVLIPPVSGG